jgi:hypothetical protein
MVVMTAGRSDRILEYALRLALVVGIAMGGTGCGAGAGGSPIAPAVPVLLQPGTYMLSIASAIDSFEPDAPCSARAGNPFNRNVETLITITREADGWLGRSRSNADGDLDLRLRAALAGEVFPGPGIPVAGTVRGLGVDTGRPAVVFLRDARVLAHGADSGLEAQLVGGLSNTGIIGIGTMTGMFTYSDKGGASTICRNAVWILTPVLPLAASSRPE